jgi:hypothetical protein
MQIRGHWQNANPNTIWAKLANRLGREPTNEEAKQEVRRILDEGLVELASAGKLKHQRRRA